MTEPEPSVPEVDTIKQWVRVYGEHDEACDFFADGPLDCDCWLAEFDTTIAALAAAEERATRAEAERDEAREKYRVLCVGWGMRRDELEGDAAKATARADTAEAQVAKVRVLHTGTHWCARSRAEWLYGYGDECPTLAALDSVGATEGEPASPTAAEPERACPVCLARDATGVGLSPAARTALTATAEPTRADEPRACPRPEAHHYQPGRADEGKA